MENKSEGSLSFLGVLTIVFITLKLCKVISWSWLWVLSPVWIPLAIGVIFCIVATIYVLVKRK